MQNKPKNITQILYQIFAISPNLSTLTLCLKTNSDYSNSAATSN